MRRSAPPFQLGFTLIEVMVGFVLVFVLMLGLNALWTQVGAQFDDLVYRQKAIFRLNGEMERLTAQYNSGTAIATAGDNHTLNVPANAGSFISTLTGSGSTAGSPPEPASRLIYGTASSPGFVLDSTVSANLASFVTAIPANDVGTATRDTYRYVLYFKDTGTPLASRNVVWLDRSRKVVAQLSWDLYQVSTSCYSGDCNLLTVYIDYPFRFNTTAGTYAPIPGTPVETITAQTLVGRVRKS